MSLGTDWPQREGLNPQADTSDLDVCWTPYNKSQKEAAGT